MESGDSHVIGVIWMPVLDGGVATHWVWVSRGLYQKESVGSLLRRDFDTHTAHSPLMSYSTPAAPVNDRKT